MDPLGGFERDKKGRISFIAVAEHVKELKVNYSIICQSNEVDNLFAIIGKSITISNL